MPNLKSSRIQTLKKDERGATAVEYGLIVALMTVALVGALAATGNSTEDQWNGVKDKIVTATN
ncbi:MAG: Flp family type IVb pilin [Pseudomonadota bacterium]